jgi:putative serine protease PepD
MPPSSASAKERSGWGRTALIAIIAGVVGALVILMLMPAVFGVNPYNLLRGRVKNETHEEVSLPKQVTNVVSPTQGTADVTAIASKVIPSIVNVDVRIPGGGEGIGSGVIYTADGSIITNNHVVAGGGSITVTLATGQDIPASVVGTDAQNDIAVIKINKNSLPPIQVGDSANLAVGQLVVAVGSPLGFTQTVTSGIISALHRNVGEPAASGSSNNILTDLIQTDAPINPGNSGGALCDSRGAIVGINTLIASQSGGSQGIGFAIPINTAKGVADALIAKQPVSHPFIGVLGQSVNPDVAAQYKLPVSSGALVTSVVPGSSAEKVGIKAGDIITSAAGQQVKSIDDLIAAVRANAVGSTIPITYISGGQQKTANVAVQEAPKTIG